MTPAQTLIRRAVVWDNHSCMPIRPLDRSFLPQLQRFREAGFSVISLNVGFGSDSIESHFRMLAQLRDWVLAHSADYCLVREVQDIHAAKRDGRLAVVFDIEGMGAVGDQPELVDLYATLGVRWMLVAFNRSNAAGGGCHDEDRGLTDFGRRVIERMNACGMLLCCSHTGERTALEAMDVSQAPVILSHSNARAVHDHPRNVSDRLIRRCAETGGVVGVNGLSVFLGGEASVNRLVQHLEHVREVVGTAHVGLGLDYVFDRQELDDWLAGPSNTWPKGYGYAPGIQMVPPEALPELVDALLARRWSDDEVLGFLGGNWLRVATQVWPQFQAS